MQTAYLYIRVSTEEQAKKGFSISQQDDLLHTYCRTNDVSILQCFREDFSAKEFHRPEWPQLLAKCIMSKKDRPDYILFTQWSRFSRNIAEAYIMIKRLQRLGITPQAVEQPLDMSIPESKLILANYLAAAEVENVRRSINVKANMYKAKLEGRWMAGAPIGYRNAMSTSGQKCIVIYKPEALLIKEAFEQVAEGVFSVSQIYQLTVSNGLSCSLNNFRHMLRNPCYCGRIMLHTGKGTPSIVDGQHEKIIPPVLFDRVQQTLNLKAANKVRRSTKTLDALFPFRGLLYCPKCGHKLTASSSSGRSSRYAYYHCKSVCGFRVRADNVHQLFTDRLKLLSPSPQYVPLFKTIIAQKYKQLLQMTTINRQRSIRKMEALQDHIISARSLLLSGDITGKDYVEIKADCLSKIGILESRVNHAALAAVRFKESIELISTFLSRLNTVFDQGELLVKKELVSWLYGDMIVWNESCFHKCPSYSACVVYDLYWGKNKTEDAAVTDFDVLPSLYQQVFKVEQHKGRWLTAVQVQNIIAFLCKGADLGIEMFMALSK